jgi:hypothetical protein
VSRPGLKCAKNWVDKSFNRETRKGLILLQITCGSWHLRPAQLTERRPLLSKVSGRFYTHLMTYYEDDILLSLLRSQTVSWPGGCAVTGWRTCWVGRRRDWTWRSLCRCCWSCVSETREPGRCTRAQCELVGKPFYLPSYNTGNCRKGLITPLTLLPPRKKKYPSPKKIVAPSPTKSHILTRKGQPESKNRRISDLWNDLK